MSNRSSEKNPLEQEALLSEERLRFLVEAVGDYAFYTLDPEGRILSWNPGAERIKGFSEEEVLGTHFSRFYFPEEIEKGRPERDLELTARHGRLEDEGWRVRKDGSRCWVASVMTAIRDEDGRLLGFAKVMRDLTGRIRAEEQFRLVVESVPNGIVLADEDGRIVLANHQAERAFAYEPGELLGQSVDTLVPERFRPVHAHLRTEFMSRPESRPMGAGRDLYALRKDGTEFPVEIGLTPMRMEGSTMVLASVVDITERKRAEEALRKNQEQMAFLAEASTLLGSSLDYEQTLRHVAALAVPRLADYCVVHVYDEDGSLEPLVVAHVDPEHRALAEELTRRYPSDPDMPYSIARVARTGEPMLLPEISEELLAAAAQDEDHLELARRLGIRSALGVALLSGERSYGALAMVSCRAAHRYNEADLQIAREVADRAAAAIENARLYRAAREAEARLVALNETLEERVRERTERLREYARELTHSNLALEQRNRELQDFAYVASHDLREPLRKVATFSDLLMSEAAPRLKDEERFYLNRMQDAAERMSALISGLLAFSQVQTKGEPFRRVDLGEIAGLVLFDLEMAIEEAGAIVEIGDMCEIDADPTQMSQLLQNLISNALKFRRSGERPVVHVRASVETFLVDGMPEPVEMCELEVKDNGIGIEEEHLERIFSPFQRLHPRTEYPGTGMGLAIVRRIAERHGGNVIARNNRDGGSTFVVRLPVHQ